MTLYEFSALDELEQAEAIWDKGVFIADRMNGEFKELLYQIDKFYVELHYHTAQNALQGLTAFESMDRLAPYLNNIPIAELLK